MKDNFSLQSDQYLQFRPTYPKALFAYLSSITPAHQTAWDCGTGNGQVALDLVNYFDLVLATDISEKQINNAVLHEKILYKVEAAESTSFQDNTFDLIAIAQAIHWFDFAAFYTEVRRTIKNRGIIAVIGYGLISAGAETDKVIKHLYYDLLGTYWDRERKYIDENYATIPFPFVELSAPKLTNEFDWKFEQLLGYLKTWSAVQHYIQKNNQDPVALIYQDLSNAWGNSEYKKISFPILLRVGQVNKS